MIVRTPFGLIAPGWPGLAGVIKRVVVVLTGIDFSSTDFSATDFAT